MKYKNRYVIRENDANKEIIDDKKLKQNKKHEKENEIDQNMIRKTIENYNF